MNPMHENLARAQMNARLGEARAQRLSNQLIRAHRQSRRAEQAARAARTALARAL